MYDAAEKIERDGIGGASGAITAGKDISGNDIVGIISLGERFVSDDGGEGAGQRSTTSSKSVDC